MGEYKLMEHLLTGEQKLFNVVTDYREQNNLIDQHPDIVARLRALADTMRADLGDMPARWEDPSHGSKGRNRRPIGRI